MSIWYKNIHYRLLCISDKINMTCYFHDHHHRLVFIFVCIVMDLWRRFLKDKNQSNVHVRMAAKKPQTFDVFVGNLPSESNEVRHKASPFLPRCICKSNDDAFEWGILIMQEWSNLTCQPPDHDFRFLHADTKLRKLGTLKKCLNTA